MKRSRWSRMILILAMVAIIAVGCGKQAASQSTAVAPSAPPAPSSAGGYANIKGAADLSYTDTATVTASEGAAQADGQVTRKVVQTGRMELEVLDHAKASDEIKALVQGAGGYIQSSSSRKNDQGRISGNLIIRVPQGKFDQLLADLSKRGKIISSDVSGRDVTEQYIDLEARLNVAKAQEVRMIAILAKAEKLEDLLKVESELARIRGEVESLQGKFNYLRNSVDLASLTVTLREVDSFTSKVKTPGWSIIDRIQKAFIGSVNVIIDLVVASIVAVIGFSPLIILLGALYLLMRRFLRFRGFRSLGAQSPKANGQSGDDEVMK